VTRPAIFVSPTTPTTVNHCWFGPGFVISSGFSGLNMRRPTGSWPGQNFRASRSSTITTRRDAAVSLSLNNRPRSNETFNVSM